MGCRASHRPRNEASQSSATHQSLSDGLTNSEPDDWSWQTLILDRYKVRGVDVLGIGTFSIVRQGLDTADNSKVAIKSLKASDAAKFRREVFLFQALLSGRMDPEERGDRTSRHRAPTLWRAEQVLQSICLPRPEKMFVQLLGHSPLDACAHDSVCYSVLELGQFTLHDLIVHCHGMEQSGHPHSLSTSDELLRVLLHTVRALAFLHSQLFVHGDLKPANLMWFGSAWKLIDLDGLLTSSQLIDMHDADFYTPIYAAPELAAAAAADGPVRVSRCMDVWSAGAVILEMELLQPALWPQFEAFCSSEPDGLAHFMQWLSEDPVPMPIPEVPRAASRELLELLAHSMLVTDTASRSIPLDLLNVPCLVQTSLNELAIPPPTVKPPTPPAPPPKAPTAFQLFREQHQPGLESQGLRGAPLKRELLRLWKQAQIAGSANLNPNPHPDPAAHPDAHLIHIKPDLSPSHAESRLDIEEL